MTTVPDYLFNSAGQWIAVLSDDKQVFDPQGKWLGFLPGDDNTVVDPEGQYLATRHGDRLYADAAATVEPVAASGAVPPSPDTLPRPPRMPVQTPPSGSKDVDLGL
jgi:hypothetical protein